MDNMFNEKAMLENHLQHNIYPPQDLRLVPACLAAIAIGVEALEDDEYKDVEVELPNGSKVLFNKLLDGLNLWDFVHMRIAAAKDEDDGDGQTLMDRELEKCDVPQA